MAQRRIDFLSLMYKKSSDPGNSRTASRLEQRSLRLSHSAAQRPLEHRCSRASFVCVNAIRTRWRPAPPAGRCIKALRRDENGVEEVGFVGYIAEATPAGNRVHVRAAGPEGLLENLPLPFEPPLIDLADEPVGYRYWWRQIVYVFDIDDPRLAPPLPSPLPPDDLECVQRFVSTSRDLADSGVVSSVGGADISIDDATGQESVVVDFPRRDLQAGFTTFLRQCQGTRDEARFDVVYGRLRRAAAGASDTRAQERIRQLDAW